MDEETHDGSVDAVAEAFMKSLPDETTPSGDKSEDALEVTEDTTEDTSEEDAADDDASDEEGEDEGGSEDSPKLADDDALVEVSVDGKAERVSVKDLKRLAGQEAAITQRSQSLAEQRKAVERQGHAAAEILQRQHARAVERFKPYKDVDLFAAARDLEPSEFQALRKEMSEAEAEVKFLEQEAESYLKQAQATQAQLVREQAKETLKVINDPTSKYHIPEWSDALYAELRTYAVGQGLGAEEVNRIVDPGAISMIRKAMLYDKAKAKSETVKEKVAKAPKKATRKSETTTPKSTSVTAARKIAMESGDLDDVTALFLAAQKNKDN